MFGSVESSFVSFWLVSVHPDSFRFVVFVSFRSFRFVSFVQSRLVYFSSVRFLVQFRFVYRFVSLNLA